MSLQRGQTSIEQLIAFLFVLMILVIAAVFATEKNRESNQLKSRIDSKRICESLADNINNIAEQGSGYYKYFSVPARLPGYDEYDISVYGNWVEVSFANYSYVSQLMTSNVSVVCLDKGGDMKNKVYSQGEMIYVICNRAELMFINRSLSPERAQPGKDINVSVKVINFGPVESGDFIVNFTSTGNTTLVPSLESEGAAYVYFNYTTPAAVGNYSLEFVIDPAGSVNESIKSNNLHNETIYVRENI